MEIPPDAIGFAVVIATLLGTAFGVKLLVWGKGPIRRLRRDTGGAEPEERLADLEERVQQLSELVTDQSHLLEDFQERLDFAERVLARRPVEGPKAVEPPAREGL